MHETPDPPKIIAENLLEIVAYHAPIHTLTARHELSRWLGWSVWLPEYKRARDSLVEFGFITYSTAPGGPPMDITDAGWKELERRKG